MNTRLQAELESARDRMSQRDRDLISVQSALKSLENERRKSGDVHASNRFSLELELDRLKRDHASLEEELESARSEIDAREETLRQRDVDRSQLVCPVYIPLVQSSRRVNSWRNCEI